MSLHTEPTAVETEPSDAEREEDRLIAEARALTEAQCRRLLASDAAIAEHLWAIGADNDAATCRWWRREVREALALMVGDEEDEAAGRDLDFDLKESRENAA